MPPKHDRQSGVVSLEMALSMPILIVVFVGVFVFAHAYYLRFVLTAKVHDSARVCATGKLAQGPCQAHAQAQIGGFSRSCDSLDIAVQVQDIPGVDHVRGVQLTVRCTYKVVGLSLISDSGSGPRLLSVTSIVPY